MFIRLGRVNSSAASLLKMNKTKINDQIQELFKNQNCIIEAVENWNERLETIEEKLDEGKIDEIKEIRGSQAIIDEIAVKNSDDMKMNVKTPMFAIFL